ncbi:hypothetical protein D3C75_756730 [compost metagenome]
MFWLAVTPNHLHPRLLHNGINHGFSKPGQMVADFHHWQGAGDVGGSDAQQLRLFELAQSFELLFFVVIRHAQQILAQLVAISIGGGRLVQRVWVEQFVEQQRVTR